MTTLFRLRQAQKLRQLSAIVLLASLLLLPAQGRSQEATPTPVTPHPSAQSISIPADGLYFTDIVVRGQPIFQVGSLSKLSATQRAQIVNRRIASILAQPQANRTVNVVTNANQGIATLQVGNRVLMTVTQQDAEDFDIELETLAQQWANKVDQAFKEPPLAIDVGQRLYATLRQFQRDTITNLPSLLGALLAVIATWLLAGSVRRLTLVGARQWQVDNNSKILVSRLVYGGVWVVGAIVTLGVLGLDFTTLLGTLGLTSVAIGFSLRDILSNYFSGIVLLASHPFSLGDQIVIKEYEGTVRQIQLRATTLLTSDGRIIYIPNQEVFSAIITNNTAYNKRRSSITVGINYNADITTTKQIINNAVFKVEGVEAEPKPEILVRELAASTVNIEVRFWVNSQRLTFLEITSQVLQATKEALQKTEIEMPTVDDVTKIIDNHTSSEQQNSSS